MARLALITSLARDCFHKDAIKAKRHAQEVNLVLPPLVSK